MTTVVAFQLHEVLVCFLPCNCAVQIVAFIIDSCSLSGGLLIIY